MPRIARIVIEKAYYHIITRGNQKQIVFVDVNDYEKYLLLLKKYKRRFGFKLYGFCLMPNHVHLVIQVKNPIELNKIMRGINLSYTLYFNFRHKKVGHLWQDRFKSKIIEKDPYFIECINYIENNPIRASLTDRPEDYFWSSFRFRISDSTLIDTLQDI